MASLTCIMFAMVLAAVLTVASSTCEDDVEVCKQYFTNANSATSKSEVCSVLGQGLKCITDIVNSDSQCTPTDKVEANMVVNELQKAINTECKGTNLMSSLVLCLALSGLTYFLTSSK